MTTYFCQHGLATGADDGSSWEDAFKDAAEIDNLTSGDVMYIKVHAGILVASANGDDIEIHGGCPVDWTGTYYNSSERTGHTVFDGDSTDAFGFNLSGDTVALSRIEAKDFTSRNFYFRNASVSYTIEDCISTGSAYGMQVLNVTGTATLTRCTVDGASTINLRLDAPDATVVVTDLVSTDGTISLDENAAYLFDRCIFTGGTTAVFAAGATITTQSYVKNSLFYDNSASSFPAILVPTGSSGLDVIGCTFAANHSTGGGCVRLGGGTISNSIFWENTSDGTDEQVDYATVDYCTVYDLAVDGLGSNATAGAGCIETDPDYLGSGDNPYELSSSSPTSVTQGADTGVTGYVDYDLLNEDRDDSTPSMGAYEYIAAGGTTFTVDADLPVPTGSADFDQEASFYVASNLPLTAVAASFSSGAMFTIDADLPLAEVAADIGQSNAFSAAGDLPLPEVAADFGSASQFSVEASSPLPVAAMDIGQNSPFSAAATLPMSEVASSFGQSNAFTVDAVTPLPEVLMLASNLPQGAFVVAADLPVPEGSMDIGQEMGFSAALQTPLAAVLAAFSNVEENEFSVSGSLPVPDALAEFGRAMPTEIAILSPLPVGAASFGQNAPFSINSILSLPVIGSSFLNPIPAISTGGMLAYFPRISATYRRPTGAYVTGRYVQDSVSETSILIIQPQRANGRDLMMFPEGERIYRHFKTWCDADLLVNDIVTINSVEYRVMLSEPWQFDGGFTKVFIREIQ